MFQFDEKFIKRVLKCDESKEHRVLGIHCFCTEDLGFVDCILKSVIVGVTKCFEPWYFGWLDDDVSGRRNYTGSSRRGWGKFLEFLDCFVVLHGLRHELKEDGVRLLLRWKFCWSITSDVCHSWFEAGKFRRRDGHHGGHGVLEELPYKRFVESRVETKRVPRFPAFRDCVLLNDL